jgi:lysozyme
MKTSLLIAAVLAPACAVDTPTLDETKQQASVCADGETVYGIDVSRFQGDIDWQPVADSGVKFAYIQISRSLTDLDAKFAYNWQHAKAAGILRGAYQRFHPGQDVIGQAKVFLDKLGPYETGDLPPMLDVEDADGLSATQIAAAVQQWMDYVEPRVGLTPIIYTGYYFWRDSVGSADFTQHPLWIANYSATCPLVPDHWTRWTFHQYSSTATVPGITQNTVDVNKFNGTLAELEALATPPAPPTCGDGTCNGDETTDSCADDCPACQMIDDGASAIVDDGSACFTAGGDPMYIRQANAGYGSSLQWTHATDLADAANYGQWDLHFAHAGRYRVEAFTPAPYNGSHQAVYQVRHGDELTPVTVDQSAVDGWNLVGDFDFVEGGHGQSIRIDDNTGEPESTDTMIVFDALRFTLLSDAPATPPDEEPGGCAAGATPSAWLLIPLLALRRRRARTRPRRI